MDIDEQDSDKSSLESGQEAVEDINDDMSDENGPYFDSSWSEADSLLNVETEHNQRTTSFLATQRQQEEEKRFIQRILSNWGTIGLVVYERSKKLNFDRRLLVGQAKHTMSKFSLGMSIEDIEREIGKAVENCFRKSLVQPTNREMYICLKMLDKILPQNL